MIKDDEILISEQAGILLFLSRCGMLPEGPIFEVSEHSPIWMLGSA